MENCLCRNWSSSDLTYPSYGVIIQCYPTDPFLTRCPVPIVNWGVGVYFFREFVEILSEFSLDKVPL